MLTCSKATGVFAALASEVCKDLVWHMAHQACGSAEAAARHFLAAKAGCERGWLEWCGLVCRVDLKRAESRTCHQQD